MCFKGKKSGKQRLANTDLNVWFSNINFIVVNSHEVLVDERNFSFARHNHMSLQYDLPG